MDSGLRRDDTGVWDADLATKKGLTGGLFIQ